MLNRTKMHTEPTSFSFNTPDMFHMSPRCLRRGVYGRSVAGIAGSKPAGGMDVYLLYVLCVVRFLCIRPVTRPEESYRVECVQ